jgi:hypothetical protein
MMRNVLWLAVFNESFAISNLFGVILSLSVAIFNLFAMALLKQ